MPPYGGMLWLEQGSLPSSLSEMNIVLIPKCDNLLSMKELRSISLCNITYKILSKALANPLKPFLLRCIDEEQSTLVEGRVILDNVMVANELMHYLRFKARGRERELVMKIEFSKAYYRLDWEYMEAVMGKMGFF